MVLQKGRIFSLLNLIIITTLSTFAHSAELFKKLDIESEFKITQPVIAADILKKAGKELLTFTVDSEGQRWLIIYALDDSSEYKEYKRIKLNNDFLNYDLAEYEVGKTQRLYFSTYSSLWMLQEGKEDLSLNLNKVMNIDSIYIDKSPQFITRGSYVKSLNDDDFDDFIFSGFDDVSVYVGESKSTWKKQSLPIPPNVKRYRERITYEQREVFLVDMNLDGATDIVLAKEGELSVFFLKESDFYESEPKLFSIKSSISGLNWWDKRDANGEGLDQSDLVYRKLEELKDINNDGVTDMIVRYTKSSGVLDRVNDYEVYFGKAVDGLVSYDDSANTVIKAEGTLTGLEFVDIDEDSIFEVLLSGFDIGLSEIIGALVAGSIDQNVFLFKLDDKNRYSKKPVVNKEVELSFSLTSGQSGSPVVQLADITGDNIKDLILSDGDDELKIYFGTSGKKLLKRKSKSYEVNLPTDGNTLYVEDLNMDGKDDILMKYGPLDAPELSNRFTILLAN